VVKSVQELIDEVLEPKEKRMRSGKFSPSSFGKCYRNQYWNRLDEPVTNPIDTRTLRVFKAGNLFHDFVQGLLINETVQKEVMVESDDVKGFADLVNSEEVIDIKSQHSQAFWYRQKEIKASNDAEKSIKSMFCNNWLQVVYYATQLLKPFVRLVFISKDDLCIAEYRQPVDGYWKTELGKELDTLRRYWSDKELPPAEPRLYKQKDGSFKECGYCQFKNKCKGEK
jgi:hypothetical protein